MASRITIVRVYKVTDGSALASDITAGSPATGANLAVEAITDFDPVDDGETRYVVIDSEHISYTDIDEDTDELVNITRGANSTVAASHTAGTFVQKGLTAKREKFADGFIDDDDTLSEGVEIPRFLWPYYQVGARDNDAMELATVEYLDDGHPIIIDAPQEDDGPDGSVALQVVPWSLDGPIAVGVREHQFPIPFGGVIMEARLSLGVNGLADDDVVADLRIDGTSILGAERVEVLEGENLSAALPLEVVVTKGQLATLEFENAGTLDPGSDPVFYFLILPGVNALGGRIEVPGLQGEQGPQGDPGEDGVDGTNGATFYGVKAKRTTNQTITTGGSNTPINFNAADDFDTDAYHDTVTNNTRLTVPTNRAGKYLVVGNATFANNTTGQRQLRIHKNGTLTAIVAVPGAANNAAMSISDVLDMAVGDYVELYVFQSSGGNLDVIASNPITFALVYQGS